MTLSKKDMAERAHRLWELEQRMLAFVGRGTGRLEHEMAEAWGITPRAVRGMIDEVRARWAAEAPVEREARRSDMRRTLEELAYAARADQKENVAIRALEMLVALDGLNSPTKAEAKIEVSRVSHDDTPEAIAEEALALLTPEQREAIIRRFGGGQ